MTFDPVNILIKHIEDHNQIVSDHSYFMFEPFDVAARHQWQIDLAKKDGVDLLADEHIKTYGQAPHEFQSGVVFNQAKLSLTIAGSQTGKALTLDTDIHTPTGTVKMGEIEVGQKVLGPDGDIRTVVGVFDQGLRPTYLLTFDDGCSCECDEEHLWKYLHPKNSQRKRWSHGKVEDNPYFEEWSVGTLKEMISRYGTGELGEGKRPYIPVVGRVDYQEKKMPIGPYAMGALIGDGSFAKGPISFTCHKDDRSMRDRLGEQLPEDARISIWKHDPDGQTCGIVGIKGYLSSLDLAGKKSAEKHIPNEYKCASFDSRLDLLRGLMDTDGSISGKCNIEYSSKSKILAEDVQWLVRSLGGKAKIKEKKCGYKKDGVYKDCGICYRVIVKMSDHCPFFLKRKVDRWYRILHRKERILHKIDFIGEKHTRCIKIDHPDGLFIINDFIVTHNTHSELIRNIATATGEFPYSLRYDKGVDTGIPRTVSVENIRRFGRRDSISGTVIDYDVKKLKDWIKGDRSWNCGNIIGAGKMPQSMVAEDGAKYWVGTTRRAYIEMWLPALNVHSKENCIIPPHFIDQSRGNRGYSAINQMVHFNRGIDFSFITYESGAVKFEAKKVFRIALDEEPPNREIFTAALTHCESLAIITTPYKGITWLKEIIDKQMDSKVIWHCTQYDSPYQDKENVDAEREATLPHERAARVWGIPVAQIEERPYFNSFKISLWMQKLKAKYSLGKFAPKLRYVGIVPTGETTLPALTEVDVELIKSEHEDKQYAWRIFKEVEPGASYALIADPAEGDEIPEDAGDSAAAIIVKKPSEPTPDEIRNGVKPWPEPVALIRSTLLCEQFAEVCLFAARYYNNATLAPESHRRGSWNALFYAKTKAWPYWYYHETEKWSTRRRRSTPGFDTNAGTRDIIFRKVKEWEEYYEESSPPPFYDDMLFEEMASCIWNKKGKPDHATKKSLDLTVCWGIALHILDESPEQFRCNVKDKDEEPSWLDRFRKSKEEHDFYDWSTFRS